MRRHDNFDYMSLLMDAELEGLESDLTALYANATNEVLSEFTRYSKKIEPELREWQELLEQGQITETEYQARVRNKIFKNALYEATVKALTNTLVSTDVAAMALIRGDLPYVIAQSYNFVQSLGWKAADDAGFSVGTFQIYNARAVQKLIKDKPEVLPHVDLPLDKKWNKDQINNVITHAIVQGEDIPTISKKLQTVVHMDKTTATRTARTAMTYAENLGRDESYENLKAKGLPVRKRWNAVIDERTRDTHRQLNGTYANKDDLFGEGILDVLLRCPADPTGEPQEIYNCRCRLGVVFDNAVVDHSKDDDLYEQFLKQNYPDDYVKLQEKDYFNQHTSKPQPASEKTAAKRQAKAKNTEKWVSKLNNQEVPEDYQWGTPEYKKWQWDYPDNHPKHVDGGYDAIKRYTGGGYTDVNKMLRGQEYKNDWWFSSPEKDAATIHKVIANAELPQDVYTIRKTTANALERLFGDGSIDRIKAGKGRDFIGSVIKEKGFYSSAMATSTAYNTPFVNYEVEFITLLPKGTNAIYIKGITARYGAEYEILTIDGSSFIIRNIVYSENGFDDISDRQSGSKIRVYLEKISDGKNKEQ